ncbi:GyrI-like domain-containing protein [Alkalihalobacillus sp. BA299]|uniref:GyrI-like domain-containing protein n=1 Tax=Alkalihalobacillus sp. BA299 TaxID=2815938 RepID=UPI001ADA6BE7|nr:GyrI-like domain-containing protein [Alkalihalobacillus sp. BA299]
MGDDEYGEIPEGMVPLSVPAQKYAVIEFRGHASQIYHVYPHLHQWVDENGYKRVSERWKLEIYSKWSKSKDHVHLCEPMF